MQHDSRIYVAGHTGLLGSALVRQMRAAGYARLVLRTHAELDLTDYQAGERFFQQERPEYVFLCAARVGGTLRNRVEPAEMLRVNLAIQTNVIHLAWRHAARKLLFVGSACAYPKQAPSPITPETLLTGPVEPTSEPFAVAKIAGVRMCQAYNAQYGTHFVTAVPATVYGPGDHFDEHGHVIASLVNRFHRAKLAGDPQVAVWGTGTPRREFLYADDAAAGLIWLMRAYDSSRVIHVAEGRDMTIADLAELVRQTVGYPGRIVFDSSQPDGMPQRLLEASALAGLGWKPQVTLAEGLRRTYAWYCQQAPHSSRSA